MKTSVDEKNTLNSMQTIIDNTMVLPSREEETSH